MKNITRLIFRLLGLFSLLLIWQFFASSGITPYLPFPIEVISKTTRLVISGDFVRDFIITTLRILSGFTVAYIVSITVALLMNYKDSLHNFLYVYVLIGLSIPALAWAMISIMIFGLSSMAAIFAVVVIVTPVLAISFNKGLESIDQDLVEMAKIYQVKGWLYVKRLLIPQLVPHILAGGRYGFSLSWKVVIIIEMLGLSSGMGYQIGNAFSLFSMQDVLAWTLIFTIFMVMVELSIFLPAERKLTSWRRTN